MAWGNHVTLTGNVTRDPELRFSPSGTAVARFGLAWNNRRTNARGEVEEEVSFFDVVAFGEFAENIAESLGKGDRVIVDGRLDQQSWEADDGSKRSRVQVIADDVAASVKWATVTIERKGGSGGGAHRDADRAADLAAAKAGGRRSAPAAEPSYEEEPF